MGGLAAGLLLVAVIFTGRLMVGLTTPIVSSAPGLQSTPTPTKTPVPVLQVSPSTVVANQTIHLSGTKFAAADVPGLPEGSEVHQITGVGDSVISVGGVPLRPPQVEYPVELGSSGELEVNVVIPVINDTIVPGATLVIKVTDSTGRSDAISVKIRKLSFSVDPDESSRGTDVTAKGSGFPAHQDDNSLGRVSLFYGIIAVGSIETDAQGNFEGAFRVPNTARIPSTTTVTASVPGTNLTSADTHRVPGPTLVLTPNKGSEGKTVKIRAFGFPGPASATTLDIGGVSLLPSPSPSTGPDGILSVSVLIPQFDVGAKVVRLTVGGVTAVTTFTIVEVVPTATPLPTATPFPDIDTAKGLEPLSGNLVRVWAFDNGTKEWSYYDPRPIFASTNTVSKLSRGQIYWIKVNIPATVILNGSRRTLFEGWNLIAW